LLVNCFVNSKLPVRFHKPYNSKPFTSSDLSQLFILNYCTVGKHYGKLYCTLFRAVGNHTRVPAAQLGPENSGAPGRGHQHPVRTQRDRPPVPVPLLWAHFGLESGRSKYSKESWTHPLLYPALPLHCSKSQYFRHQFIFNLFIQIPLYLLSSFWSLMAGRLFRISVRFMNHHHDRDNVRTEADVMNGPFFVASAGFYQKGKKRRVAFGTRMGRRRIEFNFV